MPRLVKLLAHRRGKTLKGEEKDVSGIKNTYDINQPNCAYAHLSNIQNCMHASLWKTSTYR